MTSNEGQTWTADELARDFEVLRTMSWFVVVRRHSDGKEGSMEFTGSPRVYSAWIADEDSS
jgi:hypothetical protein